MTEVEPSSKQNTQNHKIRAGYDKYDRDHYGPPRHRDDRYYDYHRDPRDRDRDRYYEDRSVATGVE